MDGLPEVRDFVSRAYGGAVSQGVRNGLALESAYLAWEAGRPTEAAAALRGSSRSMAAVRVMAALFWSGDSLDGARALQELAGLRDDEDFGRAVAAPLSRRCAMALWQLEHGDLGEVESTASFLRASAGERDPATPPGPDEVCATVLEAALAHRRGDRDAGQLIDRLDQLLLTAPFRQIGWANLAVARLLEGEGEYARAAAAARRHPYLAGYTAFLATHMRESGRLYELAGNRDGAIDAYAKYLSLRSDPEPTVADEVEQVRRALERLTAEGR